MYLTVWGCLGCCCGVFAAFAIFQQQGGQEDATALEHVVNQQRNALAEAKV